MAINQERYNQFRKDILGLQKELSFSSYNAVVQAKLIDFISGRADLKGLRNYQLRQIVKPFFDEEYQKYVKETTNKIQDALNVANHHYDDLGGAVKRDMADIVGAEQALQTRLGRYEDKAVAHIARVIKKAAKEEYSVRKTASFLRGQSEQVDFYADTLARTGIKGVSRTAKNMKADIAEVFWYEYVGIIRAETRAFCLAMLHQTRHRDTYRQMDNGQLRPVLQWCGGYNCHHDAEPDPFYKPPENWRDKLKWETVALYKGKKLRYTLKR